MYDPLRLASGLDFRPDPVNQSYTLVVDWKRNSRPATENPKAKGISGIQSSHVVQHSAVPEPKTRKRIWLKPRREGGTYFLCSSCLPSRHPLRPSPLLSSLPPHSALPFWFRFRTRRIVTQIPQVYEHNPDPNFSVLSRWIPSSVGISSRMKNSSCFVYS